MPKNKKRPRNINVYVKIDIHVNCVLPPKDGCETIEKAITEYLAKAVKDVELAV